MNAADTKASNGQVRICGALIALAGFPAAYFLRHWYVPAQWVGYFDIAAGFLMLVWPQPWRRRVALLNQRFQEMSGQ